MCPTGTDARRFRRKRSARSGAKGRQPLPDGLPSGSGRERPTVHVAQSQGEPGPGGEEAGLSPTRRGRGGTQAAPLAPRGLREPPGAAGRDPAPPRPAPRAGTGPRWRGAGSPDLRGRGLISSQGDARASGAASRRRGSGGEGGAGRAAGEAAGRAGGGRDAPQLRAGRRGGRGGSRARRGARGAGGFRGRRARVRRGSQRAGGVCAAAGGGPKPEARAGGRERAGRKGAVCARKPAGADSGRRAARQQPPSSRPARRPPAEARGSRRVKRAPGPPRAVVISILNGAGEGARRTERRGRRAAPSRSGRTRGGAGRGAGAARGARPRAAPRGERVRGRGCAARPVRGGRARTRSRCPAGRFHFEEGRARERAEPGSAGAGGSGRGTLGAPARCRPPGASEGALSCSPWTAPTLPGLGGRTEGRRGRVLKSRLPAAPSRPLSVSEASREQPVGERGSPRTEPPQVRSPPGGRAAAAPPAPRERRELRGGCASRAPRPADSGDPAWLRPRVRDWHRARGKGRTFLKRLRGGFSSFNLERINCLFIQHRSALGHPPSPPRAAPAPFLPRVEA